MAFSYHEPEYVKLLMYESMFSRTFDFGFLPLRVEVFLQYAGQVSAALGHELNFYSVFQFYDLGSINFIL
jgi:hypothetical protein